MALWRHKVVGEAIKRKPAFEPALSGWFVALDHFQASLLTHLSHALLCFKENHQVLSVQELFVAGKLNEKEIDFGSGTQVMKHFDELLLCHVRTRFVLSLVELLELQLYLNIF